MRCGGEEGRRVKNDWEDFHGCVVEGWGGGSKKTICSVTWVRCGGVVKKSKDSIR